MQRSRDCVAETDVEGVVIRSYRVIRPWRCVVRGVRVSAHPRDLLVPELPLPLFYAAVERDARELYDNVRLP
jgi:hypothetical protein